ncbi:hypothetical protein ASE06_14555 [Sphingopyxis sp. Root214]|nr:hypothetical protein [Sphingopyxis sp. Root154]KQZ74319.1 hypothetical protein ASD73_12210 [Sphingopyxis sp. Root154]KRC08458.1 hypothetical protein ASE06_14555 [Sphingopyxis sp. Root214]
MAATLAGCATTTTRANPQDAFFDALSARCGKAYAGRLASDQEADADMRGKAMVMHIRHCTADRIEIPFHIDGLAEGGEWDRSRTWIISRTGAGLRLKHDHRHADGKPDDVTLYGGDTADAGTATRQTFPVDAESIAMFTATGRSVSNTNIWSVETTDAGFTYGLDRQGRHFRVAFDYAKPVTPPPAPWGW